MKVLMSIVLIAATAALFGGIEISEPPELDRWSRSTGAVLEKVGKNKFRLASGKIVTDKICPAKYGECVSVTMLYSGKGSLLLTMREHDASGAIVKTSYYRFNNARDEIHSRSTTFDVSCLATTACSFELDAGKKSDMAVGKITIRRMYGAENALYSPLLSRDLWQKRTAGKNLAAGLKPTFIPKPNYELTMKGDTDSTDLTDGKLSVKYRDHIWFDSNAVAWSGNLKKCAMKFDFGSPKPVDRIVMRICGGRLDEYHGQGWFPELFEIWVSLDDKNYYKASSLKKVKINEKADADWKTLYYLPETNSGEAPPYVYPFSIDVNAEARFIAIVMNKSSSILALDEVAVIEGSRTRADFNSARKNKPNPLLFHKEAIVSPFYPEFYVPRGVNLPNFFKFEDNRDVKGGKIFYSVNLPEQVVYDPDDTGWPAYMRSLVKTERKNGRSIWHFTFKTDYKTAARLAPRFGVGPFYFRADSDIPEKEKYAEFTTTADAGRSVVKRMKLNVVELPEFKRFKNLMLGSVWFGQRITLHWPGFVDSAKKIGFNATGYHGKFNEKHRPFVDSLVKNGIKIVGVPNVFISALCKNDDERNSVKCDNWRKVKAHNSLCPAYRGKIYQAFCREIEEQMKMIPHNDNIHLDYELWFAPSAFKTCARCDALRKTKNMTWGQYAGWAMADSYSGVAAAARRARPKAVIGSYMFCADRTQSVDKTVFPIFGFNNLYPKMLDEAHTPYYGSNPAQVTKRVRSNFMYMRDPRKTVAYLTGGTGAYYTDLMGRATEFELIEAYMNGAYSIAYYVDRSFSSPLDFLYIARGAKAVAPYDEFLVKARLMPEFKGSNPDLNYTCRRLGKKALVLVGNYGTSKRAKTFLAMPDLKNAVNCITGEKMSFSDKGISLEIQGDDIIFAELEFK